MVRGQHQVEASKIRRESLRQDIRQDRYSRRELEESLDRRVRGSKGERKPTTRTKTGKEESRVGL